VHKLQARHSMTMQSCLLVHHDLAKPAQVQEQAERNSSSLSHLSAICTAAVNGSVTGAILAQHASMLSRHHHCLSISNRSKRLEHAVTESTLHAKQLLQAAAAKRHEAIELHSAALSLPASAVPDGTGGAADVLKVCGARACVD
jgi:hypothetical protein